MWGNTAAWWRCSRRAAFSLRADTDAGPPTNTVLAAPDGSWCEVRETTTDGAHQVWEAGPHHRHRRTPVAWLDSPDGEHTWNLAA